MKRRYSDEQELEICRRYEAGTTTTELVKEFAASGSQMIVNVLDRYGIEKRSRNPTVSEETRKAIIEFCKTGSGTIVAAASKFGVGKRFVSRLVHDNSIVMREGAPPACEINHAAFDDSTPEADYWTGFLFADGCIHYDKYGAPCIAMGLSFNDIGHVEKFKNFLGSSHAISRIEPGRQTLGGPQAFFKVRSERLVRALERRGMIENKPDRVPTNALSDSRDFWRGMIDGDGTICIVDKAGVSIPFVKLAGQLKIVEAFADYTAKKFETKWAPSATASGIWTVGTGYKMAQRIISDLYRNSSVSLDRKMERAVLAMKCFV